MNRMYSGIIIVSLLLTPCLFGMHHEEEPKLHQAVRARNMDLLREVLQTQDLNIDEPDAEGNTALHIAAQESSQEKEDALTGPEAIIKELLAHGASTKARNLEKKIPFDYAKNPSITNLLLLNCASPRIERHVPEHEIYQLESGQNVTLADDAPKKRRSSFLKRLTGELRKSLEK